jgi:hypothetical protein
LFPFVPRPCHSKPQTVVFSLLLPVNVPKVHLIQALERTRGFTDSYRQRQSYGLRQQSANNPAGASTETAVWDLVSGGLLRVQAGVFTSPPCHCNDVQIDAGATLRPMAAVTYHLTGKWTNNGSYLAADADAVRFEGSAEQAIGGSSETRVGTLAIANPAGVKPNADGQDSKTLTLDGDVTTTGSNRLTLTRGATTGGAGDVFGRVRRLGPFDAGAA